MSRRVVDFQRLFPYQLQAKNPAFSREFNLTGQSDAFGQSAQLIG